MDHDFELLSSPLQGFTDYRFRNLFQKYFGGIDVFYAPYVRLSGDGEIKAAYERDLKPENNAAVRLVPQVMTNDAEGFLAVAKYVRSLGYAELNWNLGCPYPMVAHKGLGSGLLAQPEKIDEILRRVADESDIEVSIKMRLGYDDPGEILRLLPVLDAHSLKNIVIHPRIGRQLYKGSADLEAFAQCLPLTRHVVYYNGDIDSVAAFEQLRERFPGIRYWMIGRWILSNPFLAGMIKEGRHELPEDWTDVFEKFHQELFEQMAISHSGARHIILKMYSYWEYFISLFEHAPKGLKKIKKAKDLDAYFQAVNDILDSAR